MSKLFLFAIVLLSSPAALAGTIYKCVENGKTSYADQPCGKNPVPLALRVAPAAPGEAAERLARSKAYLASVEAERADEAVDAARAARVAAKYQREQAQQQRRCDKLRLEAKWLAEDSRRTQGEAGERARTKARREAEAVAVECPA